jgi:hypothetical protein
MSMQQTRPDSHAGVPEAGDQQPEQLVPTTQLPVP